MNKLLRIEEENFKGCAVFLGSQVWGDNSHNFAENMTEKDTQKIRKNDDGLKEI